MEGKITWILKGLVMNLLIKIHILILLERLLHTHILMIIFVRLF
jgi:hypothetical protein